MYIVNVHNGSFFFSQDWCYLFVAEVKAGMFFHVCVCEGGGVPLMPYIVKNNRIFSQQLGFGGNGWS